MISLRVVFNLHFSVQQPMQNNLQNDSSTSKISFQGTLKTEYEVNCGRESANESAPEDTRKMH